MRASHLSMALAAICMVAAFAVSGVAGSPGVFRDRPPPAHTGGFGEPSCQYCHTDAADNSGPGALTVSGLPGGGFVPGQSYDLTVRLADPQLRAGGFQMSVRFEDGRQAGHLAAAPGEEGRIAVTVASDVAYAHHLYDGSVPGSPGSMAWSVRWTAPETGRAVRVHVAAVAGDDDLSNLGDLVYTTSAAVPARAVK